MRKITITLLLLLVSLVSFADHTEEKPDLSQVRGCKQYFYLYGAQYHKGDVVGIVYYISPDMKTMKIMPKSNRVIPGKNKYDVTYAEAKQICREKGFNLPTAEELRMMFFHIPLMDWNVTYRVGAGHTVRDLTDEEYWMWASTSDSYWSADYYDKDNIVVVRGYVPENRSLYAPLYHDSYDLKGNSVHQANIHRVIGTKDVPFEPQYLRGTYDYLGL